MFSRETFLVHICVRKVEIEKFLLFYGEGNGWRKNKDHLYASYMHHVLEAKLIVGNMVLSVASEFIENES
jgi:hypothetical protein